ncbi:MAG: hypothetical protein EP349_02270 [Alphaproteobacteria bacterium]|nr:MAG: hypothetical protein EP349_02270 [Alphaproteobacteria bacterium]
MQRFVITNSDIGQEKFRSTGAVLAIGNLDGVHKGHAALLSQTRELAAAKGVPAVVMSFSPHPRLFFQPDAQPFLLIDDDTKAALLEEKGIDCLYSVQFDAALSEMSALDFIRSLLVGTVGCGTVIVGEDFRFGKSRLGDIDILKQAGEAYGFELQTLKLVTDNGNNIFSSSRIRDCLREGDIAATNALLGWNWHYPVTVLDNQPDPSGLNCLSAKTANPALLSPKSGGYTGLAHIAENGQLSNTIQKVFILHNTPDLVKIFYDARFCTAPISAGATLVLQPENETQTQTLSAKTAEWLTQQENKRESL